MISKVRVFLLVLVLLFSASTSFALQSLTQNEFTTAESLDPGMTQAGVFISAGNKYMSYTPAFRYGLGAFFEVGVRAGAITVDISTKKKLSALLGGDIKYQLIKQTDDIPVDLAVDIGFDTTFVSGDNISELAFSTVVSRAIPLTERGYKVTPYAGAEMSAQYSSSMYAKDDTSFFAFGGIEWKISQKFMLVAEVKGGSSTVGGIGIKFEY